MKDIILCAFKIDGQENKYNVWRYDTPSTELILFSVYANSNEHAKEMAMNKIIGIV